MKKKDRIEVNEKYELEYSITDNITDHDYNRQHSVCLIRKKEPKNERVIWMDNFHSKSDGRWPTHIHKPEGGRHSFLGGSWEDVVKTFLEIALKLIGDENRKDLERALSQMEINNIPSGDLLEKIGLQHKIDVK